MKSKEIDHQPPTTFNPETKFSAGRGGGGRGGGGASCNLEAGKITLATRPTRATTQRREEGENKEGENLEQKLFHLILLSYFFSCFAQHSGISMYVEMVLPSTENIVKVRFTLMLKHNCCCLSVAFWWSGVKLSFMVTYFVNLRFYCTSR